MRIDVFISYPHAERTVANAACAALESANVRCWIAPRDILPSAPWTAAIVQAIDNCRVMVLIFSSKTNESQQVRREVDRAFSKGVPVVPLRIEQVIPEATLAYFLNSVHWLDALTPPLEQHLKHLTEVVKALLEAGSVNDKKQEHAGSQDQPAADAPERTVGTGGEQRSRADRVTPPISIDESGSLKWVTLGAGANVLSCLWYLPSIILVYPLTGICLSQFVDPRVVWWKWPAEFIPAVSQSMRGKIPQEVLGRIKELAPKTAAPDAATSDSVLRKAGLLLILLAIFRSILVLLAALSANFYNQNPVLLILSIYLGFGWPAFLTTIAGVGVIRRRHWARLFGIGACVVCGIFDLVLFLGVVIDSIGRTNWSAGAPSASILITALTAVHLAAYFYISVRLYRWNPTR